MAEGRRRDDQAGDQEEERLPEGSYTGSTSGWLWNYLGGFAEEREKLRETDQERSHEEGHGE